MSMESLTAVKTILGSIEADPAGIERFLSFLGYPILPQKEQPLDPDTLFQQKELRERIAGARKLFSMQATWEHPSTGQTFKREAAVVLIETTDDQVLKTRLSFEISRYAVKFGLPATQALFFLVAPKSRSFVVITYEASETADKTQVRRLIVDLDNVARTDVDALSGLFFSKMTQETIIQRFRAALPYLKVGREFFQQYHDFFSKLSTRVSKVLGSDQEAYGYVQRLMGRITFLYFLQRKGWLDGDRSYLKRRTGKLGGLELFDFLQELFDRLNTEDHPPDKGKIPYLNGSLFEEERYPRPQLRRIGEACAPFLGDLMKTLDQYNFTISESTPLDKEVAVDPELLGSLFESMLPETERGDKGTFYTHQEEMLFMAGEAMRVYLQRFHNLLSQAQIFYLVHGLELPTSEKIEPKLARDVKDRLRAIKVLDPAVGSGGFLMAMLQRLLETRSRLNGIVGTVERDYDSKLEMIENSLFGIDIEEEAIELARLRLWLTLVVDEPVENVRPLPNLDYNLHKGDSLKIPEFEKQRQAKLTVDMTIRGALLNEITSVREEYSRSHGKEKETKRTELDAALRKLLEVETGVRPPRIIPFSYRFFFADLMAGGGFDIVLMNPPYIQQEDIGKLPSQDPKTYKSDIALDAELLTEKKFSPNKQSDISVYFHIRSLSLLRDGGAAVVIATNKWLDARYGVPLQEYLLKNATLECVYDSARKSFSAEVNTVITIVRRTSERSLDNIVRFVNFQSPFGDVSADLLREVADEMNEGVHFRKMYRITARSQQHLCEDGLSEENEEVAPSEAGNEKLVIVEGPNSGGIGGQKEYVGTKWGNLHLRAPSVYYQLLVRAGTKLVPLGKSDRILRGFTSGNIDFFILSRIKSESTKLVRCRNGFGHKFVVENEFCPPILRDPEDVSTYFLKSSEVSNRVFLCRLPRSRLRGTHALDYIKWGETSDEAKVKVLRGKDKGKKVRIPDLATVSGRLEWYQLPNTLPTRLLLPKIVKNRHVIPLCEHEVYATDNYNMLYANNPLDLWLYLNSSVFRLFMELNGRSEGAGALQVMAYEYRQCPALIPLPALSGSFKKLQVFKSRVAHRFVNISESGPLEFDQEDRRELDQLVLESMGFTDKKERGEVLEQIYSWLRARVQERLLKAKSGPESVVNNLGGRGGQADLREFE